jgi:hypothetical protein
MPLFEIEVGAHPNTLVMPGLDPGIHPSSQNVSFEESAFAL